jgi:DNA-binding winged helix-turn-helix (wHTH) protein
MTLSRSLARVRFGVFEFDLTTDELYKRGFKIALSQHALRILGLLLEHPGQVRTREEIRERLWGGATYVNFDQSISKAIYQLRSALNDNVNNPLFIETVPGSGYRFIYFIQSPVRFSQQSTERVPVVAVVPFFVESPGPDTEHFRSRLVKAIIDLLSSESLVRVLPYGTVQHFWRNDLDPERFGQTLLADVVVAGEIIQEHENVYVHIELIDVSTGTQVWGSEFKDIFSEALAHPENLAKAIHSQLRVKLERSDQRGSMQNQKAS